MKVFKGAGQIFAAFLAVLLLASCGGGGGGGSGGGGGNQASSSSEPGTVKNGAYSISVDKTSVDFDVPFKGSTGIATIKVTYSGDGLIAGSLPGETLDSHLGVSLVATSSTTANLNLSVNYSFTEARTYTQRLRLVTGKEDGSKYVTKDIVITMKQLDGFAVTAYTGDIAGLWGDTPRTAEFLIESFAKKWTVSSSFAGLTFSADTGTGNKSITVSYDPLKTPVNTKNVEVVFTADTGEKVVKTLNFVLTAPDFSTTNLDINFPNQVLGKSLEPVDIDLNTNNIPLTWTATLPAWLSAKSLTGVTGKDKLQVYVDASKFPEQDGILSGQIHVQADLPGGKVERDIKVNFPYQQTRMQASQAAFAFSDYGTNQAHEGDFWINTPTNSNTQVVSNSSWLTIDSVADSKVQFHLNAGALPQGFQTAEIALSQPDNKAVVPTKVYVGYYKSGAPLIFGAASTLPREAFAVRDKLGPYIYIGNGEDSGKIITKYNLATRSVEKTLEIKEYPVSSLVISDDGQYMFGLSYDRNVYSGRLIIINLKDFSSYSIAPMNNNSLERALYARISGKDMVSDGFGLFDAFNGNLLVYSGYSGDAFPSPSGEFSLAAGSDTIGYIHYDYDYLTGEFKRSYILGGISLSGYKIANVSNNGKYLGVLNRPWTQTGSRNLLIYKVDVDAQNRPGFTELHNNLVADEAYEGSPPGIIMGDDGRFALYSVSYGGANKLEVYRADQSLVASHSQPNSFSPSKGKSWFYTSDSKALIYFEGAIGENQTLYIYATE